MTLERQVAHLPTLDAFSTRVNVTTPLGGPVEIMEFPFSHTDTPEEKLWDAFEERWEELARDGVPPDFGRRPTVAGLA